MTPINSIEKKLLALRDAASEVYVAAVEALGEVERLKELPPAHKEFKSLKEKHLDLLDNHNWGRQKKKLKVSL